MSGRTRAELYATTLGGWVRRNRVALGLSQGDLAQALRAESLDASTASISNWECGRVMMSAFARAKLRLFFTRTLEERQRVAVNARNSADEAST